MAKKAAKKSRSSKSKPARAAKPQVKAKPAAQGGAKPPKRVAASASSRAASSRGKAATAASGSRAFKDRQQPETLRCKPLSVALTADDIERSLKFWVDGVGFHVKQRWEEDGKLLGAELVAGACMIGLSQDDWSKGRGRAKGVGVGMSIYAETTQTVDALAERLRSRGISFEGPETTRWGSRQLKLRDPDGFGLTVYEERKG